MNEEITLGQLLQTMTTSTKVKIVDESDIIYIGTAIHAFDTSSTDTLAKTVTSIKATEQNTQLIRL